MTVGNDAVLALRVGRLKVGGPASREDSWIGVWAGT